MTDLNQLTPEDAQAIAQEIIQQLNDAMVEIEEEYEAAGGASVMESAFGAREGFERVDLSGRVQSLIRDLDYAVRQIKAGRLALLGPLQSYLTSARYFLEKRSQMSPAAYESLRKSAEAAALVGRGHRGTATLAALLLGSGLLLTRGIRRFFGKERPERDYNIGFDRPAPSRRRDLGDEYSRTGLR